MGGLARALACEIEGGMSNSTTDDVTQILQRVAGGEEGAAAELFQAVYDELHALPAPTPSRHGQTEG